MSGDIIDFSKISKEDLLKLPREELEKLARAAQAQLFQAETLQYEKSLYKFTEAAWKYIDPAQFVHGFHLEAVCEHLEAVTNGEIKRLLVQLPPRCCKSSILAVSWPAWVWCRRQDKFPSKLSGSKVQFMFSSYAQTLSFRDSTRTRDVIQSPWYQERWGRVLQIAPGKDTKHKFDNTAGGYRIATSVGGSTMGFGGTVLSVDDLLSAQDAESKLMLQSAVDWYDMAFSTRLSDPKIGAIVVQGQRLSDGDIHGHILSKNKGEWTVLCLPMEYEPSRVWPVNKIGWKDPRTEEGQLLWPEQWPRKEVELLKKDLGPYGAAAQLQQNPIPVGGGIIKREWWQDWDEKIAKEHNAWSFDKEKILYPKMDFVLASLDAAYTEKQENDPSALTIWGMFRDKYDHPKIFLRYAWEGRQNIHDLVNTVSEKCDLHNVDKLIIESKASGISVSQELQRMFRVGKQWTVELMDPKKLDKVARMHAVVPMFSEKMVFAPLSTSWAKMLVEQITRFPKAKNDDLSDSTAQALKYLRDAGFALRRDEIAEEFEHSIQYHKPEKPLYAV